MVDLFNKKLFAQKLKDNLLEKNEIFKKAFKHEGFEFEDIYREYLGYARKLKSYVTNVPVVLAEACLSGKSILSKGLKGHF